MQNTALRYVIFLALKITAKTSTKRFVKKCILQQLRQRSFQKCYYPQVYSEIKTTKFEMS